MEWYKFMDSIKSDKDTERWNDGFKFINIYAEM